MDEATTSGGHGVRWRRTRRVGGALLWAVRSVLSVVLVVAYLLILMTYVVPLLRGGTSFAVTDEDRPSAVADGSVAFVRPVSEDDIEVGDIVTADDGGNGTWRVLIIDGDGKVFVESPEGNVAAFDAEVEGQVWAHLVVLGAVRNALASPLGLALLLPTTLGLLIWGWATRRARARARARGRARREVVPDVLFGPPEPPVEQAIAVVRLQVAVVVLSEVDDAELAIALAEFGGSVIDHVGPMTRLVQLTGPVAAVDEAIERLGRVGVVDAVTRSGELAFEVPVPAVIDVAA